jgi:hypothetical protein
MAHEIGLDLSLAKLAAEEASDWDAELHSIARDLTQLGIHTAPALRWHGQICTGLVAICTLLADSGSRQPSLD